MGTNAVLQREYIGTLGALTVPGLDTIYSTQSEGFRQGCTISDNTPPWAERASSHAAAEEHMAQRRQSSYAAAEEQNAQNWTRRSN